MIIGAGVAGCAAAATAIELGRRVVVLEAGSAGPLPAQLRSIDLTEAHQAAGWWWPGYPAGRGIGGGSAVNGMVVQRPAADDRSAFGLDAEVAWAWAALAPVPFEPGALSSALAQLADQGRWRVEPAPLAVRRRRRLTAADTWLRQGNDLLAVHGGREVTRGDVRAWARHRIVLVAAGALRSPALVGVDPRPMLDHRAAVLTLDLPASLRTLGPDAPAATMILRAGHVQVLVMDHTGRDRAGAALIVMSMKEDPDGTVLGDGLAAARDLVASAGLQGSIAPEPSPVAHACCTLTGLDLPVPVVDASTLAALPEATPMLVVAAHARRATLDALGA